MTVLREPVSRLMSLWLYWRAQTDEQLKPWGDWGDRSRVPLREFLDLRDVACQTDSQSVRMLLWPHPLIPPDDYIDDRHDRVLVAEAASRLDRFSFVDVVENPQLAANLQNWFGRSLAVNKLNETGSSPQELRTSIDDELDADVLSLLEHRSRLDLKLWQAVVARRMRQVDYAAFRDDVRAANAARHSRLMAH